MYSVFFDFEQSAAGLFHYVAFFFILLKKECAKMPLTKSLFRVEFECGLSADGYWVYKHTLQIVYVYIISCGHVQQ